MAYASRSEVNGLDIVCREWLVARWAPPHSVLDTLVHTGPREGVAAAHQRDLLGLMLEDRAVDLRVCVCADAAGGHLLHEHLAFGFDLVRPVLHQLHQLAVR